mgnify:CR=1 FL=1
MKIETGYYWVKHYGEWIIGYYNGNYEYWELCGSDVSVKTSSLQEIDYKKITR